MHTGWAQHVSAKQTLVFAEQVKLVKHGSNSGQENEGAQITWFVSATAYAWQICVHELLEPFFHEQRGAEQVDIDRLIWPFLHKEKKNIFALLFFHERVPWAVWSKIHMIITE